MKFVKARQIFREQGGILSTSRAIELGIYPKTLYNMRNQGIIEQLARGLFRLKDSPALSHPDLIIIARKAPHAVICLISALAFHEITTQIPRQVDIAIPLKAHKPQIDYPPVKIFWYSKALFEEGIESHLLDGTQILVYSLEKTLADCFKYRNKIGLDIAIEALKLYWQRKKPNVSKLLKYSKICRCEKIIKPYIEMIAHG